METSSSGSAYRRLTLSPAEVAEHNGLHDAFDDARQRAALPVAERDALDAQLESMERAAREREAERSAKAAERQRLATDGDLDAVERVQARLLALDAVEGAQAEVAQSVRRRRAELVDHVIPTADDAVQEAYDRVAAWSADHEGMVPRGLVDRAVLNQVRIYASQGFLDDEDAEDFVASIQGLPDLMTGRVAADPEKFSATADPRLSEQHMSAATARRLLPEIQAALAREAAANNAAAFGAQAGAFTRGAAEPVYAPFERTRMGG